MAKDAGGGQDGGMTIDKVPNVQNHFEDVDM